MPRTAMTIWVLNRIVNAVVLIGLVVLLGAIAFGWFGALTNPRSDPHGYVQIFGVLVSVVLLVPLVLLITGALHLRRHRRAGLVHQVLAGAVIGVYGLLLSSTPAGWIGLGLGAALLGSAVAGLIRTRQGPPSGR